MSFNFKGFFNGLARILAKAALYVASHPDVVQAVVSAVQKPSVASVEGAVDTATKQ